MKKYLFFGISSVLDTAGNLIIKDLDLLKEFCDYSKIELFLIGGFNRIKLNKIVTDANLNLYFKSKNIISIDNSYLTSLSDLDQNIRLEKLVLDPDYEDLYFKVYYFNNLFLENKSNILFIGKDVFLDGYYVSHYSNVDFVLLENKLTFNNKPIDVGRVKDLFLIKNESKSIIKFLKTKNKFSYIKLNTFVNNYLFKNIIGDTNNILSNPKVSEFIIQNLKKNKK